MTARTRGFTLVEAVVVIGLIGIMTALSVNAFSGLPTRARLSNDFLDLAVTVRYAKARAAASGYDVYMLVSTKAQAIYIIEDTDGNFPDTTLTGFQFDKPLADQRTYCAGVGDRILRRIEFSYVEEAGHKKYTVGFADAGFSETTLYPKPFQGIDPSSPCTFCGKYPSPENVGAIQFRPDGEISIIGDTSAPGAGLIVQTYTGQARDTNSRRALLVASPTGLSRTYFP